ncbi:MAG: thermonuclease family protein [Candidatus Izemoplasmatales bacterium]
MIKRFFTLLVAAFATVVLTGCTTTTTAATTATTVPTTETTTTTDELVTVPDLTGMSRADITSTLTALGLTVRYYFDVSVVYDDESDYDKFVKFGSGIVTGSLVAPGTEIRVYTTPLHLEVEYYPNISEYVDDDDVPLQITPADYADKEFIADGIGEVTVFRYVDGDTTHFESNGTSFSVRYLGIDTPESTALYEPWGKTAANYTKAVLQSAETIVLQAEGERMDGNGRYLAWIWYRTSAEGEFYLLNLELVELAYSKSKVSVGSRFTQILTLADWNASLTKRRVWGELDPLYDYSKEGTQMSIRHLLENFNDYVGLKVVVTGTVTARLGKSVYIQDDEGYGVFIYSMTGSVVLQVGANVTIGALTPTYYSGSPQLTNFNTINMSLNSTGNIVEPLLMTYEAFTFTRIGAYVRLSQLEIVSINAAGSSVVCEDASGHRIVVRIDSDTGFTAEDLGLSVGQIVSVNGPLGYYDFSFESPDGYVYDNDRFQLMLTLAADITIIE